MQAAKNGKPILIPIALMNNHRMLVTADSVTTVQELCHQICDRIGITDDSGFSVYITLMQRVWNTLKIISSYIQLSQKV